MNRNRNLKLKHNHDPIRRKSRRVAPIASEQVQVETKPMISELRRHGSAHTRQITAQAPAKNKPCKPKGDPTQQNAPL